METNPVAYNIYKNQSFYWHNVIKGNGYNKKNMADEEYRYLVIRNK